jgi:prephenate dehydrogenase
VQIGKLVVVGVGLIGASCALALRAAGAVKTIVGVGRGRANLDAALARKAIDRAYLLDAPWTAETADADIVLVAAPVAHYPALFAAIAPAMGKATIVTDAGSTKQDVVAAAHAAFGAGMTRFVPAHPIAGSDRSGAAAADAGLFGGRVVVLTPVPATAANAMARVTAMWQATGARITTLAPVEHDRVFAAVSHLPHVLAFALVAEFAARPDAAALLAQAGSGFRDFTRIAASSPEMWRDIAVANRLALQDEIARFRVALDDVEAMIAIGDGAALLALFERAAAARRALAATLPASDDGS